MVVILQATFSNLNVFLGAHFFYILISLVSICGKSALVQITAW